MLFYLLIYFFVLGAAHGLCTILQVLISFPCFIKKEPKAIQDIKKCIHLLISIQTSNGNFPTKIQELGSNKRPEEDELVHWCHGAPGDLDFITSTVLYILYFYLPNCCRHYTNPP